MRAKCDATQTLNMAKNHMLTTSNQNFGFFGTALQQGGKAFAKLAWVTAFNHVQERMEWGDELTRDFLDSRCGRHYADTMTGSLDWRGSLIQYVHLESECRAFFKDVSPAAYNAWCSANGNSPTERSMIHTKISFEDIFNTVRNLTELNYSKPQVESAINAAAPLAHALALILANIPEEIREMYTAKSRAEFALKRRASRV